MGLIDLYPSYSFQNRATKRKVNHNFNSRLNNFLFLLLYYFCINAHCLKCTYLHYKWLFGFIQKRVTFPMPKHRDKNNTTRYQMMSLHTIFNETF